MFPANLCTQLFMYNAWILFSPWGSMFSRMLLDLVLDVWRVLLSAET